jgi:hypothetical protein
VPHFSYLNLRAGRWCLALFGITAGLVFVFGDPGKWQATPSLLLLHDMPVIPLDFWGWVGVAYGLLLISDRTKVYGYALGAILIGVLVSSILLTLKDPGPRNIWTAAFGLDLFVYHCMAIRLATVSRLIK